MKYQAEIVIARPNGPESDCGMPSYRLPFQPTKELAELTGMAELSKRKAPAGTMYFNVLDERGNAA